MLKSLRMQFDSRTEIVDLVAARAANRCDWVRVLSLSLVVAGALSLQGCLAGAWVALVAVDTMRSNNVTVGLFEQSWVGQVAVNTGRSSHVNFGQFEKSWVAKQDQLSDAGYNLIVRSVAVLPVEGDPDMGARLATLLQQETTLRVKSPVTAVEGITAADLPSGQTDGLDHSALAKEVSRELGVDTILVSRVADVPSHPSDWGRKAEGSRRLYLYLVNHDGRLLWKDELPFTQVKGSTPSFDTSVQTDLTHHVMQHVKALHLDDLGYLPNKEKRRKASRPAATLTPIE